MERPRYYFIDRNHEVHPCELMDNARMFQSPSDCRVASSFGNRIKYKKFWKFKFPYSIDRVHVSTVFLGLDHNWHEGPPLLFETMAFMDDANDPDHQTCIRYSTWNEAVAGHKKMCKEFFWFYNG